MWPQTSLNMPTRCGIRKNSSLPNLQIFEICKIVPKIAKCIDLARNIKKFALDKFANFINSRNSLKSYQMRLFVEKYRKIWVSKLDNFFNFQDNLTIRQICRFVEKQQKNPSWQLATPLQLTAEWEVINNWRYLAKYESYVNIFSDL